jgi:hypothetical protein
MIPIILVGGANAAGVEGKGRIPIGHRRDAGHPFDGRRQRGIVGRSGQFHHGRQAQGDRSFACKSFDAFRLEVRHAHRVARLGVKLVGRPGIQGDFVRF